MLPFAQTFGLRHLLIHQRWKERHGGIGEETDQLLQLAVSSLVHTANNKEAIMRLPLANEFDFYFPLLL